MQSGEDLVNGRVLPHIPQSLRVVDRHDAVPARLWFRPAGWIVCLHVEELTDRRTDRSAERFGHHVFHQQVAVFRETSFVSLGDHGFNRTMSELLISIDLGTTRLKIAAFGLDGTLQHLLVRRHEEHRQRFQGHERSWQGADDWWRDTVEGIRELHSVLDHRPVIGIGLTGRGGGAVFADAAGEVIADPWSDKRHQAEVEQLEDWGGEQPLPSYGLQLIAKYLWLKAHHPVMATAIHQGFFAKDWLLFRLTGAHLTDWTSGPDGPIWDERLITLGLPESLLPEPSLPWEQAGTLTRSTAGQLGLPVRTPVAVGAHDGLAANIGAGAIATGDCAITGGTHAVVRTVIADQPPGSHRFYGFPPDRHIVGGNALFTGRSADWFLDLTDRVAVEADRAARFGELDKAAAQVSVGADGVRFLPFLSGSVAPEARPAARAMFSGLRLAHGQAELYRALLEGGSFAIRGVFDQVCDWCGFPDRVRVTGGGSESELWMQILASTINRPIELTGRAVEARGAAVCLAVALGIHGDLGGAADAMIRVEGVIEPEPQLVDEYELIYRHWLQVNVVSRDLDPSG